jgi:serine/threonine protein kinase
MQDSDKEYSLNEDALRSFYSAEEQELLSEEEAGALTPILDSLSSLAERYRELEPIAEGGEKKITRVYDSILGRSIAMARPVRADSRQDEEDFLREARLAAGLEHPNIVAIHNIGIDESGIPFFTMELLPGDSLKDIVDRLRANDPDYRKRYNQDALLNIFLKVCDAMAYAHDRRVIHLDLKPENIRVGRYGEVFVCDWGLAKVLPSGQNTTLDTLDGDLLNDINLSGMLNGTPGYMAPEQGLKGSGYNEGMDIYALGVMLYMLLTHHLPVDGSSANEVLKNTQAGKTIPIHRRNINGRVPKSLAAVAMRAIAFTPEQRYRSVENLREDISRYMAGHSTEAEKAGPLTQAGYLVRRHSTTTLLLILFMGVLTITVFAGLLRIRDQRNRADVAHQEAVEARETAEHNLSLFVTEQQRSTQLGTELEDVVQRAGISADWINARAMLSVLDKGLQEKENSWEKNQLLETKGFMHFILQEFNAAQATFARIENPGALQKLQQISADYARLKPDDSALLTEIQLGELFIRTRQQYVAQQDGHAPIFQYMYYHHIKRRPDMPPEEYIPLCSAILYQLNGIRHWEIVPLKISKGTRGWKLDLSGSHLFKYRLEIMGADRMNVLWPFGTFESLDISHTPIVHLAELGGVNTRRFRMVGLNLAHPAVVPERLQYMPALEELVIDLYRYPPETRERLTQQKYKVSVE